VSSIPIPNHQAATYLLSLTLLGVLTSSHINKIDDHRKRIRTTHKQSNKQKGKLL